VNSNSDTGQPVPRRREIPRYHGRLCTTRDRVLLQGNLLNILTPEHGETKRLRRCQQNR